jgi:hypothetical protein
MEDMMSDEPRTLGNELADVFAMLHPSMMPALRLQLEAFKRDALDDQQDALAERADKAIAAVDLVIAEQDALEQQTH